MRDSLTCLRSLAENGQYRIVGPAFLYSDSG
jgi:hypothetical protein